MNIEMEDRSVIGAERSYKEKGSGDYTHTHTHTHTHMNEVSTCITTEM